MEVQWFEDGRRCPERETQACVRRFCAWIRNRTRCAITLEGVVGVEKQLKERVLAGGRDIGDGADRRPDGFRGILLRDTEEQRRDDVVKTSSG